MQVKQKGNLGRAVLCCAWNEPPFPIPSTFKTCKSLNVCQKAGTTPFNAGSCNCFRSDLGLTKPV
eukprot:498828-Pelagomonas_calceolata.AAC.2